MRRFIFFVVLAGLVAVQCKKVPYPPSTAVRVHNVPVKLFLTNSESVIPLPDGDFIIRGKYGVSSTYFNLTKIRPNGSVVWQKDYGLMNMWQNGFGCQSLKGNLFFSAISTNVDNKEVRIIRVSQPGDLEWNKIVFSTTSYPRVGPVIATADGNLIFCYAIRDTAVASVWKLVLLKMDDDGKVIWQKVHTDFYTTTLRAMIELPGGDIAVLCPKSDNSTVQLAKFDASGELLWKKEIPEETPEDQEIVYDMVAGTNGNLTVCGEYIVKKTKDHQVLLMQIDAVGNLVWRKKFGHDAQNEAAYSIARNYNGSCVMTGFSEGDPTGGNSILALQTNDNGDMEYYKAFGAGVSSAGYRVFCNASNDATLVGVKTTQTRTATFSDVIVAHLNSAGIFQ